MKTENELNAEILEMTMIIQEKFPELSKYIAEIPISIRNEAMPEISLQVLEEYYETLQTLVNDYAQSHHRKTK